MSDNSYATALTMAGATVIAFSAFGSYQGEWWAKLADGYVTGYYGSCSGCDEVEALTICYEHWDVHHEDCEACQKYFAELLAVGQRYLEGKRYTQEEAELKASKELEWDMGAKEMVAWLIGNRSTP